MTTKKQKQTSYQIFSRISLTRLEELVSLFIRSIEFEVGILLFVRPGEIIRVIQVGDKKFELSESQMQELASLCLKQNGQLYISDLDKLKSFSVGTLSPLSILLEFEVLDESFGEGVILMAFHFQEKNDSRTNIRCEDFLRLIRLEFDYEKLREKNFQLEQECVDVKKNFYRTEVAIDGLQEGLVEQDAHGKIIAWNQAALSILHMTEDQINGKDSNDPVWGAIKEDGSFFPGNEHPSMVALKTKRPVREVIMGLVNPNRSSEISWIKINAYPYQIGDDWFVSALFVDVTQDIVLQRELQRAEARWNLALESAHQGVWDWDIAQGKLFTSRHWKKMLGYSEDEIGDSLEEWSSRVHDEDRDKAVALLQDVLDGKKDTYEAHYRMICKDGQIRYHFDRGAVVERDADGNPLRMIGTNTDESDIVEQKLQFEKVSTYLETVINSLPFVALVLDENRDIRYKNSLSETVLGMSDSAFSPRVLEGFFPDPIIRNEFLRRYQSLESGWHEFSVYSPKGEVIFTKWKFQRFQENSVLVLMQDITQDRSQSLLLKKMSYALDQTQDGVIMTDLSGVTVYANDSSQRMFGYDYLSDELIGQHVGSLDVSSEDLPKDMLSSEEIILELQSKRTWSGKMKQKRKDGSIIYTYVTATLMVDEHDEPLGMIGILRDISEEDKLRQSLEENRLKLGAVVENLPVGVFTVDRDGRLETYNAIIRKLLLEGAPQVLKTLLVSDIFASYTVFGVGCVELTLSDLPPFQAIQTGQVVKNRDIEIVNNATRESISLNVVAAPLIGNSGENYGAVCIVEDITTSKQIEDAKTEFVSMASHQLRTPLTSLKWNLELLEDSDLHCLTDSQLEQVDEIHTSTYRMIGLVNSLLNVSRIEMGTFAINSENIVLRKHVSIVIDRFKEILHNRSIQVSESFHQSPRHYQIDPVVLDIIFENLLSNAIKYSHDGSKIEISISQEQDIHQTHKDQKKALLIQVKDFGIGIPSAEQSQIFRRLYRASNAVARNTIGTGIGLYMVKKVVNEIGGNIWFETEEGKGTIFYVSLPWEGVASREGEKVLEKHSVQE